MSQIDHKTCGHINHVTLDGSRHAEMHTAVFGLIQKWASEANRLDSHDLEPNVSDAIRLCVKDLVDAMHPFEIEQ